MLKLKSFLLSLVACLVTLGSYVATPVALVAVSQPAAAAECSLYETIHPNFPLTGAHLSTGKCSTCASCHSSGIYLGTPKVCMTCHDGDPSHLPAIGHTTAHIPHAGVNCDSCHNTASFTATWAMNHANVGAQRCDSCHSGAYVSYGAMGKDTNHIVTTQDCVSCHAPMDMPTHTNGDWFIPIDAIHNGITTGCVSCHDNVHAKGKASYAPGHPTTSDQCETCHSIHTSFKCASLIDAIKRFFS